MKHQRLLHTNQGRHCRPAAAGLDQPVLPGGLPVPRLRRPVMPGPVGVLPVPRGEEEPLRILRLYHRLIGEVPGLTLADIDFGDDGEGVGVDAAVDLALEVVVDEFLVCGVEAEAEGELLDGDQRH